jgi:hypothetical protein
MSFDEYAAFPAVNASLLKYRTPAEMFAGLTAPAKQTDALTDGTLLHLAVLEPDVNWTERFEAVDVPINPATGKAYGPETKKAEAVWAAARQKNEGKGKILVTVDGFKQHVATLRSMKAAVQVNEYASKALEDCHKEASCILWHPRWQCWVKWRVDFMPKNLAWLGDLKSTSRHVADFGREARKFGYYLQAVWYAHCHAVLLAQKGITARMPYFRFIVVSKEDTSRHPRPAMCRAEELPLMGEALSEFGGVMTARKVLGLPEGLSRVDMFLECARNYQQAGCPTEWSAIRQCWPAYEQEPGDTGGWHVLNDK